jgi:prepilin-type N-terminal cleavage/methylation domain-containing protein
MEKKKGFTIIEVSLVLAIAGLILILAFIALPGLQRTQRDSRRKDDMMKLADSIKKFQSNNNRGALPTDSNQLTDNVVSVFIGEFTDPDGTDYNVVLDDCSDGKTTGSDCQVASGKAESKHNMVFVSGASCGENNNAIKSANKRKGAILYKLEIGDLYCYGL